VVVRPVRISRQLGSEIVIASGIKAGDRVITEIPQALQPGATVRLAGSESTGEKGKGKKGKSPKKNEGKSESKKAEG